MSSKSCGLGEETSLIEETDAMEYGSGNLCESKPSESAQPADLLDTDRSSHPSKSDTPKFKKTPSLEKKFGLLFTDAAHTILE